MTWAFWFALTWAGIGLVAVLFLAWSHLTEARERARWAAHQWRVDEDRQARLEAATEPLQFKGYRMPRGGE